jgi:hypothetical protein
LALRHDRVRLLLRLHDRVLRLGRIDWLLGRRVLSGRVLDRRVLDRRLDRLLRRRDWLRSLAVLVAVHGVLEAPQGSTDGGPRVGQLARSHDDQDDYEDDDQMGWSQAPRHGCFSLWVD